jgi:Bacterial TSP3 repeat
MTRAGRSGWIPIVVDVFAAASALASMGLAGVAASAADLTSANYRHRAGAFGAIGSGPLVSAAPDPALIRSGVALGSNALVAAAGRPGSLWSNLPGFFWIQAGASPSLDLDFDGLSFLLDDDDDGDGLLDVHETNNSFFEGPQRTGTSPVVVDSDGDGVADGVEVANGSDPTDPASSGPPPALPSFGASARLCLFGLLVALGSGALPGRKASPRKGRS